VSAERGFAAAADVRAARALGARYVVIGSAITDPVQLTRGFVAALG
jgi:putative N-acetylmannosamine-6-phosphate epimerase